MLKLVCFKFGNVNIKAYLCRIKNEEKSMSKSIFYIGPSGAGKTSAIRTLEPKETFIFNALAKELPWRGSAKQYTYWDKEKNPNGNMIKSSSAPEIIRWMKHISANVPHVKEIVIDDNTFVTSLELQRRKDESWSKYDVIVQNFLDLAEASKGLRDDINVHILHHTQVVGDGILEDKTFKAMSYGKFLDEKLGTQEAQFTIVLRAAKEVDGKDINYVFYTKDAGSTAKTPFEMFEDDKIPNDLALVSRTIRCYYEDDCQEDVEKETIKSKKQ